MPFINNQYTSPSGKADPSKSPIEYGYVLIGFSILCFVTAWWFSFDDGKPIRFETPVKGSMEGRTFNVPEDNSVYLATIVQSPSGLQVNSGRSDIEIEIMDKDENVLFSFGGELREMTEVPGRRSRVSLG